jgi:hypothetical protein
MKEEWLRDGLEEFFLYGGDETIICSNGFWGEALNIEINKYF